MPSPTNSPSLKLQVYGLEGAVMQSHFQERDSALTINLTTDNGSPGKPNGTGKTILFSKTVDISDMLRSKPYLMKAD